MKNFTKEEYDQGQYWGISSSIDLYSCQGDIIRDADKIRQFVVELCELIEMKRYGDCQVIHFGEDPRVAGFSMTQLIETSLISGHFANQNNNAYLDVFSCQYYDPETAAAFAKKYFKADKHVLKYTFRK